MHTTTRKCPVTDAVVYLYHGGGARAVPYTFLPGSFKKLASLGAWRHGHECDVARVTDMSGRKLTPNDIEWPEEVSSEIERTHWRARH